MHKMFYKYLINFINILLYIYNVYIHICMHITCGSYSGILGKVRAAMYMWDHSVKFAMTWSTTF